MPAELSPETGYGLILCPQPPAVRTILLHEGGKKRLAFPHTLFGLFYFRNEQFQFQLKRLHVAFSQTPFTGDREEKLYGLPMRNHNEAFATCLYEWLGEQTAEAFTKKIICQYWHSPFAEYGDWASWWTNRYKVLDPTFLKRWEDATYLEEPFIFNEALLQSDYTVSIGKLLDSNKSHYTQGGIEIINLSNERQIAL